MKADILRLFCYTTKSKVDRKVPNGFLNEFKIGIIFAYNFIN